MEPVHDFEMLVVEYVEVLRRHKSWRNEVYVAYIRGRSTNQRNLDAVNEAMKRLGWKDEVLEVRGGKT